MALNDWSEVVPKLLAQGLLALREECVMPRLVNRGYEREAGNKGSSIDVPIPSAVSVGDVTAAAAPSQPTNQAPTVVSINMNYWREAEFYLTDKEMLEVMRGTIPMQASEAIKALANDIDSKLLALYKKVYGWSGVAGTTPFETDVSEYLDARKVLALQLAPMDSRAMVLDPTAESKALLLRAFQDASFRGDQAGIVKGQIGEKLGAKWVMDQNIPTHTAGAASGATASGTAGTNTLTFQSAGTNDILVGDIITIAGDTQTYTVLTATGLDDVSDGGSATVAPVLKTSPSSAAVTVKASHVVNLLFHRDAFALAMRPFAGADPMGLGKFQSAVDPVSGLALRLEVIRGKKETIFSYDVLYGVECVRPELACRVAG